MRLIDADALRRRKELRFSLMAAITTIQFLIDEAPTVEERKQGHWIDITFDASMCSVCQNTQEYETKYCPECGAKMDGEPE